MGTAFGNILSLNWFNGVFRKISTKITNKQYEFNVINDIK